MGLFLFTLRNGRLSDPQRGGGMCYAEKPSISKQDHLSPMHTHVINAGEIIIRGHTMMVIELYGADPDGNFDEPARGVVRCDGIRQPFQPDKKFKSAPGESVKLMVGDRHAFWGEGGR